MHVNVTDINTTSCEEALQLKIIQKDKGNMSLALIFDSHCSILCDGQMSLKATITKGTYVKGKTTITLSLFLSCSSLASYCK